MYIHQAKQKCKIFQDPGRTINLHIAIFPRKKKKNSAGISTKKACPVPKSQYTTN